MTKQSAIEMLKCLGVKDFSPENLFRLEEQLSDRYPETIWGNFCKRVRKIIGA